MRSWPIWQHTILIFNQTFCYNLTFNSKETLVMGVLLYHFCILQILQKNCGYIEIENSILSTSKVCSHFPWRCSIRFGPFQGYKQNLLPPYKNKDKKSCNFVILVVIGWVISAANHVHSISQWKSKVNWLN